MSQQWPHNTTIPCYIMQTLTSSWWLFKVAPTLLRLFIRPLWGTSHNTLNFLPSQHGQQGLWNNQRCLNKPKSAKFSFFFQRNNITALIFFSPHSPTVSKRLNKRLIRICPLHSESQACSFLSITLLVPCHCRLNWAWTLLSWLVPWCCLYVLFQL